MFREEILRFSISGAALRLSFLTVVVAALSTPASSAPAFTKLYSFCQQANCTDGMNPHLGSPLVLSNGDIMGTTEKGGDFNSGTIWQLKKSGSSYTYNRVRNFCNDAPVCTDGGYPVGQLIEDKDGNLYGVAGFGSRIYKLVPNAQRTSWTYSVVYSFTDTSKGFSPGAGLAYQGQAEGELWDGHSPLYGTTLTGGSKFQGVVYRLNPSGGSWTQDVLYNFCSKTDCADGGTPTYVKLLVDKKGKTITGTASTNGANGGGVLFQLKAGKKDWKYTVLYQFCSKEPLCADGKHPESGVIADKKGNFYGTTVSTNVDGGIVYMLKPGKKPKLTVLYQYCQTDCKDGDSLWGGLAMDKLGNLYAVSENAGIGTGGGTVMMLSKKGKKYKPTLLYSFCTEANCTDGANPWTAVTLDSGGTLFGVTNFGGAGNNGGVVFSVKP
jgi:uncharacterized repeat protein (TIGR03803 family)